MILDLDADQPPASGQEMVRMNDTENEECSLLLILVFGSCFHLPSVVFCCSSLLVVFEE